MKNISRKFLKIILFLLFTLIWSIFIYLINGEWLYFIPLLIADVIFFETISWQFWKKKKKKKKEAEKEDPKIVRLTHVIISTFMIVGLLIVLYSASITFKIIAVAVLIHIFGFIRKGFSIAYKELKSWNNAIIFAVIAATILRTFLIEAYTIPTSSMEKSMLIGDFLFVSKTSYGPRVPITPIAFPLVHHTLPFTKNKKSYSEAIKLSYHRMKGLGDVERNDCVVFNWPAEKLDRPVDKKENYVKRCVGIPGDKIEVINGVLNVNKLPQEEPIGMKKQFIYKVKTKGSGLNPKILYNKFDITKNDIYRSGNNEYSIFLTEYSSKEIQKFNNVTSVERNIDTTKINLEYTFPNNKSTDWNIDNFGPITIPKRGSTIKLNTKNIAIYREIIERYESNTLKENDEGIFINDILTSEYTFQMNYYWMMGDNRHNSADSRMWGFVPEDHIVGKALFVWMSWDTNAKGLNKIRWNRLFTSVK
mgnify:CR=1 FL=1|jgi:signal peptidase I|tara:strand:- start:715 stop:2142 length:1428 start_codon:yes stop_codon:yes gene_type:complete